MFYEPSINVCMAFQANKLVSIVCIEMEVYYGLNAGVQYKSFTIEKENDKRYALSRTNCKIIKTRKTKQKY